MDSPHRRRASRNRAPSPTPDVQRPANEAKRLTAETLGGFVGVMLKADAVADLLNVNRKAVYNLTRSGELPHVRVGGRIRYPSVRIAEYIESKSDGGPRRRE